MKVTIYKHFDYLTPFSEAANDDELAKIMRLKYPAACGNLERDAGFFASMVDDVQKYKAWKVIGFANFEDFCKAELGKTLCEVEQIVSGVRVLQASGRTAPITERQARTAAQHAREQAVEVRQGQPKKESNVDNVNITSSVKRGGNGSEYLLRRLAKTAPDILDRYEAGEFKSVRAASIAAGHIKVATVLERLLKLWEKATEEEKAKFDTLRDS
jgi:hypothetical protein